MTTPLDPSNPYPDIIQYPLYQGVFTPDMISPEPTPTPTPPSITFSFPDLTSTAQLLFIKQWFSSKLLEDGCAWAGNYTGPAGMQIITSTLTPTDTGKPPTMTMANTALIKEMSTAFTETEALRLKAKAAFQTDEWESARDAFITSFNNLTRFD